jgi:hypothetical protein
MDQGAKTAELGRRFKKNIPLVINNDKKIHSSLEHTHSILQIAMVIFPRQYI